MKQPTCIALRKAWLNTDRNAFVDGEHPSACVLFASAGQVRLVSDLEGVENASEYFSVANESPKEKEPTPARPELEQEGTSSDSEPKRRGRPPKDA